MKHVFKSCALFVLVAMLAACGGGSSSPAPVVTAPPTPPVTPPAQVRYVDHIFDSATRTSNVTYGLGARTGDDQVLQMDIYTPDGDTETDRPVLVLAFGGGFVAGFKRDPLISSIAQDFARRGYVTASIDYRFFETTPATEDEFNIAVMQSMHDMKAAVRFLREDADGADIYGTRGDVIFVGGVSAGGIMASYSGALDLQDDLSDGVRDFLDANNGLAGNSSTNTQIDSNVQGVFSISGAVSNFLWIDMNSAPIYAAHEEFDPTVPCRFAISSQGAPLAGGCDMVQRAQSFSVPAKLYLVEDSTNHVGYSAEQYAEFLDEAAMFFEARIP